MSTKLDPLKEDWYALDPHSSNVEPEKKKHHTPSPETMDWIGLHIVLPVLVGALSAVITSRLMRRGN